MGMGNWKLNALGQESRQSVLACILGVEKTNKILVENMEIIAKFVMQLLWSLNPSSPEVQTRSKTALLLKCCKLRCR